MFKRYFILDHFKSKGCSYQRDSFFHYMNET